ncbi:MAG: glycosyltransferase family 39 protein [Chloroflexi bacterium]|nr:glycosyltransferase family 39 protein [Chloroflexota bacterium]
MNSYSKRIYIFAIIIRLIPVLLSYNLAIGLDDMFQYDMLARSISSGEGYRWYSEPDLHRVQRYIDFEFDPDEYDPRGVQTSFRAPGYPLFLALIYLFSGMQWRFFIARLVQVFIMASLAPMTYLLARRVFPEEPRIARFSALTIAFYPLLVVFPLALATEVIFIPLVLAAVFVLLRAGETHSTRDYVIAGVLFGFATLTRSVVTAVIPFVMLWIWFYAKDKKGVLIIPLSVLALTLPWAARNSLLHERLMYVESSMGYNLHMGYHPEGSGTFQFGISLELLTYLDDAERDQVGIEKALGYIRDDPGRVPYLMARKLGYFFGLEHRPLKYFYSNNFFGFIPYPLLLSIFLLFDLPFVLIMVLFGIAVPFVRWRKETVLLGLIMLGYLLPHILTMSEPRFHLTIVPFLSIFAGYAWVKRKEIFARARTPKVRPALFLAIGLITLLIFNWGLELIRDADDLALLFGPEGNMARFDY